MWLAKCALGDKAESSFAFAYLIHLLAFSSGIQIESVPSFYKTMILMSDRRKYPSVPKLSYYPNRLADIVFFASFEQALEYGSEASVFAFKKISPSAVSL